MIKLSDGVGRLVDIVAIGLAAAVVGVAGYRYMSRPAVPGVDPVKVQEWESYHKGSSITSNTSAPISIVEFSDFQCPYCKKMAATLADIEARLGSKVRIVYRHLPLPNHDHARPAALASECAAAKGKFREFYDVLFAVQDSIGKIGWGNLAARAQIADTTAFTRCVSDSTHIARIRSDEAAAARLKVTATPTLMVNEWNVGSNPALLAEVLAKISATQISSTTSK